MRRFRFTIIAVCLILAWLAYADITLFGRNPSPKEMTVSAIETDGPKREWLRITDGYIDLTQAINMSGSMEIDSFLVPLMTAPDAQHIKVWFETRDPAIIETLKIYYFQLDSKEQRKSYEASHQEQFFGQRAVTGMLTSGLVANSNREKLIQLLHEMNVAVPPDILFISEGKQPPKWRGFLFAIIAIAGIFKLGRDIRQNPQK